MAIFFRRFLAVWLILALILALFVTLIIDRASATLLNPGFYTEQLRDAEIYDLFSEEVLPEAVDEFLKRQQADLPENLTAINLPSDPGSQQTIVALIRELFPPEYPQETTEEVLDAFLPYLFARTEQFEFTISLHDKINRMTAHAPGEPSRLEQAYGDLDLGRAVIEGVVAAFAEGADGSGGPVIEDEGVVLAQLVADPEGAIAWFDSELFAVIDQLRPWVVGESEGFLVQVRFDQYPEMAGPLAGPLGREPAVLLSDGYVTSEQEVREALESAGSDVLNDVGRSLAIFRAEGWSYDQERLAEDRAAGRAQDLAASADGGEAETGLDVDAVRNAARLVDTLRWVGIGVVAVMVLVVGMLGGRSWPTRLMWAATALLIASGIVFAVAGPLGYAPRLSPKIHELLLESTEDWGGARARLREPLVERGQAIADEFVGGITSGSRNVLIGSGVALAGAIAWASWRRRTGEEQYEPGAARVE